MANENEASPSPVADRAVGRKRTVGFKLFVLLAFLLAVSFGFLLWSVDRVVRSNLEDSVVRHGLQVGDLIKQATFHSMATGDRETLTNIVRDIGSTQGMEGMSIYNKSGQMMFSSRPQDIGQIMGKDAPQCVACHAQGERAQTGPKLRYYSAANGTRVLGLANTFDNSASCSNAACHAHDPSVKVLGVLDLQLPLEEVDRAAAAARNRIVLMSLGFISITVLLVWAFIHRVVNRPLSELLSGARKLANMDLDARVQVHSYDEVGEVAEAFNTMVQSLRALAQAISETSLQVNAAAAELFAASRQQEQGATQQSSAAEQTRRTMEGLVGSARQIAESTRQVLQSAEMTLDINKVGAERTKKLSQHTQRITEILENVKDIANRSEILALNAALEGAKAGEVGRGFSLVAAQMQRLAENVADSVKSVRGLVGDIRDATSASVLATEEGAKLAATMTDSARRINFITQQQESATAEVSRSMGDVAHVGVETVASSRQIAGAAEQLSAQSETLRNLVARFRLGH
jgi:methyl-accepting chemotaxis protein